MKAGTFIVIDGIDGCGKTTQAQRLVDALKARCAGEAHPPEILHLREPGATAIGEKVRAILLDKNHDAMCMETEMLLYMASRAQLVAETLQPALARGAIVVCERFLISTIAYQGYAGGIDVKTIETIGAFATRSITPDATFVLDIDEQAGLARLSGAKDRIEKRAIEFHKKVRNGFLAYARKHPETIFVIDASRPMDAVHKEIMEKVHDVL